MSGRCSLTDGEVGRVGDPNSTSREDLRGLLEHPMDETVSRRSNRLAIIFQSSRSCTLEDILFLLRERIEDLWRDSEILREDGLGCTSHIVCQEESRVFREVSVIEYEQEFYSLLACSYLSASAWLQLTLNSVRVASGEIPQISFL